MAELKEIQLPKLGESIVGATVVQWLKNVGDHVSLDEPLLEVSTDKVNSEIPSPYAGVLKEVLVSVDDEIEVGAPLARIEVLDSAEAAAPSQTATPSAAPKAAESGREDVFSPAVLRLAQAEGISMETLATIQGTGGGGRVTRKDLQRFLDAAQPAAAAGEERIKLTGMRKAIADNMSRSKREIPHASLISEVDVTDIMTHIAKEKESFKQKHGFKLTFTTFLLQAFAKALAQFPLVNASVEGEEIVMKNDINIGVAVNIDGGLIVPVLKKCQERDLNSLAQGVSDLAHRARTSALKPDDVQEGTITLTNFGMAGALVGMPIIPHPHVAILGAGAIEKRPVVLEDDTIAVRQRLYLTLTFDHRVVDGILGCQFLEVIKSNLETNQ